MTRMAQFKTWRISTLDLNFYWNNLLFAGVVCSNCHSRSSTVAHCTLATSWFEKWRSTFGRDAMGTSKRLLRICWRSGQRYHSHESGLMNRQNIIRIHANPVNLVFIWVPVTGIRWWRFKEPLTNYLIKQQQEVDSWNIFHIFYFMCKLT